MCFTSGLGLERRGKEEGSSMLFREIFLSLSQQTKERQAKRKGITVSGYLLQGLVHQITDPGEPLR